MGKAKKAEGGGPEVLLSPQDSHGRRKSMRKKPVLWFGSAVLGAAIMLITATLAFSGQRETPRLMPGSPPVPGLKDHYLGIDNGRLLVSESPVIKRPPVIRCKMGYDSVLVFPGREVKKVFLGGYSWSGSVVTQGVKNKSAKFLPPAGVVVLNPPAMIPVSSNLVVVFDHGISIFRLKVVDPDNWFMARTVVRFTKDQRLK